MPSFTYQMLYLGTLADMDTNETNNTAENVGGVIGNRVFGSAETPLFSQSTQVTLNDNRGTGNFVSLNHNQPGGTGAPDNITYTLNHTTYTLQADSTIRVYNVSVRQAIGGGLARTITVPIRLIQDANGNVFLMPPPAVGSETGESAITEFPIISVSVPTAPMSVSDFGGITAGRNLLPFRDGYVDGTDGNNVIDQAYIDGAGDRVDANDAILPGMTGNDDHIRAGLGNDSVSAGAGNDIVEGGSGEDTLLGGAGNDTLMGGADNDTLDGGAGTDLLTGGGGFDVFIASDGDTITDFNNATGQTLNDDRSDNNDLVDLSAYYNDANLAIINAQREADGQKPYFSKLGWLRADQEDGRLDDISTANGFGSNFSMTIQNGGTAVAKDKLTVDNTKVVCFSADVLIETDGVPVTAGDLNVGDLVRTRDAGFQPIRWIGKRRLDLATLQSSANLQPIRIRKDALGAGIPSADLVVSPQHRILIRSKIAQNMFGAPEVLVAAKHLTLLDGIDVAHDLDSVVYVHFLFDDHQIVFSNGAETESLYAGAEALKSVGAAAREEILNLFPELEDRTTQPARELLSAKMGRKLADRHVRNNRALVS